MILDTHTDSQTLHTNRQTLIQTDMIPDTHTDSQTLHTNRQTLILTDMIPDTHTDSQTLHTNRQTLIQTDIIPDTHTDSQTLHTNRQTLILTDMIPDTHTDSQRKMTRATEVKLIMGTKVLSCAGKAGFPTNRLGSDKTRGQGSFSPSTGGPDLQGSLQPAELTKAPQDFTVSDLEHKLNSHLTDLESTTVRWSSQLLFLAQAGCTTQNELALVQTCDL